MPLLGCRRRRAVDFDAFEIDVARVLGLGLQVDVPALLPRRDQQLQHVARRPHIGHLHAHPQGGAGDRRRRVVHADALKRRLRSGRFHIPVAGACVIARGASTAAVAAGAGGALPHVSHTRRCTHARRLWRACVLWAHAPQRTPAPATTRAPALEMASSRARAVAGNPPSRWLYRARARQQLARRGVRYLGAAVCAHLRE